MAPGTFSLTAELHPGFPALKELWCDIHVGHGIFEGFTCQNNAVCFQLHRLINPHHPIYRAVLLLYGISVLILSSLPPPQKYILTVGFGMAAGTITP